MILENVTELESSLQVHSEVFEFPIVALDSQVVTLMVRPNDRHQDLVLWRTYRVIYRARGTVAARPVTFEAGSIAKVDRIEARLQIEWPSWANGELLVGKRSPGFAPDGIPVSITTKPSGGGIIVPCYFSPTTRMDVRRQQGHDDGPQEAAAVDVGHFGYQASWSM